MWLRLPFKKKKKKKCGQGQLLMGMLICVHTSRDLAIGISHYGLISFRLFVHIKFFNVECVCVYIYIKYFIINIYHMVFLCYYSFLLPTISIILFFYLQLYKYVFVYSIFFSIKLNIFCVFV